MPATARRRWIRLAAAVAIPVLALLAFDSNWLKAPLERAVSARLGRPFEIRGELDVIPRLPLRFRMTDVRLANPPWAVEPETLRLPAVEFSIAALPLLTGRVVLPYVTLTQPAIALERSAEGANNWTFAPAEPPKPDEEPGVPPVIGRLTVDEGLLIFHDRGADTAVRVEVATLDGAEPGVRYAVHGLWKGQRLEARGIGGAILSLADTELAYPLRVEFTVGPTHGTLDGTITGLAAFGAADLTLDVAGESLSELFPLIGVALPPTPPYRIAGQLVREGAHWRMHGFEGRVGDSDLSGDVDVALTEARPHVTARLASRVIDLDDLGGFIGATPQTGPGETASPRQARQKAEAERRPTLLPDIPLKLGRLRAMDADVRFTGASIRGRTPLENFKAHFALKGGVLTLKPLDFGIAGGDVVSTLVLDGTGEVARADGTFEFRRIDLRKLFPGNAMIQKSAGIVGGNAQLAGTGNSLADVLGTADGNIGIAMSGGEVSNLVLELAGLDIAEALQLLFGGDKAVAVRCAVADFGVRAGMMEARSMILDTTDTNVNITGRVNLATEELDLTLHPLPKDYSPLTLRTPIHVTGRFKDPKIRPDEKLVYRGGIAAILGAIAAPVTALIGLIETGPGDDADCERLIAAVERHSGSVPEAHAP